MSDDTKLIERLVADEPALLSSLDFGPWVSQGTGTGPSLLIGDQSEISLMRNARSSHLDHRMAHLAKPGDVVLVRQRNPEFEAYLAEYRGFSDVTFLSAQNADADPVSKQAYSTPALFEALIKMARNAGGLTVNSYLTTGNTWRLAQAIGEAAKCMIHVSGPSPRVARRVNDKLWFTRLARQVIGNEAVPPTMSAYGPDAAAALVARFGKSASQVIVKVPDSAGSAGNMRFEAAFLRDKSTSQIKSLLQDQLHATGWADSYPILVGVWDTDVTCTPSVQLWIPQVGEGPPVSHGVFEQQVFGDAAAFVGAVRSTLPDAVQCDLVAQSVKIATVLQHLGYYGRCSFDAVICNRNDNPNTIHWIECNGRWSGVSIPLAILHAIAPDQDALGILVTQYPLPGVTVTVSQAVKALDGGLYHHATSAVDVILLSPPPSASGSIANMLAFGDTQSTAARSGRAAIQRLRELTSLT
jgi:hypothetical protein